MSGGHFDYFHDKITQQIYNWELDAGYNLGSKEQVWSANKARHMDPLNDVELSEMLYDLACVMKAHDWYVSGDTGPEDYDEAKQYFKNKWFGKTQKQRIDAQVEKAAIQLKRKIKNMFKQEDPYEDE